MSDVHDQSPRPEELQRLEDEAHLLDLGNLPEVAAWIATAMASGVVGNTAHGLLRSVRKRFGSDRLAELREKVYEEMKRLRRKPSASNRDLRNRVDRLFDELDA